MNFFTNPSSRTIHVGALLAVLTAAGLSACSGDDGASSSTAGAGGTTSSSTTSTGGASATGGAAPTTTGSTTSSSSSSSSGTGGSKPVKPADCEELSLAGVTLVSQQQNSFDSSDSVPVVRSPSATTSITGDATLFDRIRILFDGDAAVGVHALDGDPTHALPDYATTFLPTCEACATFQLDLDKASSTYAKTFAAKSGELEITNLVTPHQTAGAVRHVELREVTADPSTGAYGFVSGGACYWIEEATYDVRRPNGCAPFVTGSCPADHYCMPTNSIGTDGECVSLGTKGLGEACTFVDDTHWDSDCGVGLRCIDANGASTCYQVCDVRSSAPGCPDDTHCGGGYNVCLDAATTAGSGIDPAKVGSACDTDPYALYCGGDGRPGTCWDDDADGPLPSTCIPWASAPSQCQAPQTAGYVAYKNNADSSTLFCFKP
ncbi:putative lipoprotein [Minicystis rosea]|nr:putative lipoprotein [Minicystis rosea]